MLKTTSVLRAALFACATPALGCGSLVDGFLDASAEQPDGCDQPTVPLVRWTTKEAGTSQVEFGPDTAYEYSTPIQTEETTEHEVLLAGLAAGRTWHWRAVSEVNGKREVSEDHEVETCAADDDLPDLTVDEYDPARADLGWVVTSNIAEKSFAMLFNRDGEYVWWQRGGERLVIARSRLARNGKDVLYIVANHNHLLDAGEIVRAPLDGTTETRTRTVMSHHDFVELPNGNFLHLKADVRPWPDYEEDVVGDTVIEVEPDGTIVRELWSTWNDLSPVGLVPEDDRGFYPQGLDWTHCNSLIHVEEEDAVYLSCKHLSAVFKIDFTTGERIWQLGGEGSYFLLVDGEGFEGQHSIARTERGVMLFNNRADIVDENDEFWSEAVEFELDEERWVYSRVWSYDANKEFYTFLMGDSDYVSNGNIQTSWGIRGVVREIDPEGQVAWSIGTSVGHGLGYTSFIETIGPVE